MSDTDVHGPIDFVLIELPGNGKGDAVAAAVLDLVDRGTIRLYDVLVVTKDEDGTIAGIELQDVTPEGIGSFSAFAGARSGLLGDDDIAEAGAALQPGTVAVLLVYENAWAIPFVAAALDAGGELVASARIPAVEVMAALDALETTA
jgi:uncharacterized membrane protein